MPKSHCQQGQTEGTAEVKLSQFIPWYPTHPQLYMMETLIYREDRKQPIDKSGLRFGMREISTTTNKFILNGKPIYVRCMGDMALYLDTIAPPVDINWYLPKLKRDPRLWDQYGQSLRGNLVAGLCGGGG